MSIDTVPLKRAARTAATVVAALLAAACGQAIAETTETSELRVCFPENDPPRSTRGGGGFDIDVAGHLARQLGRRLVIVWLPEEAQTDIESTDADYRPLLMGQCDLQLSVPGAEAIKRYRRWLVLSEPYYGAGFEVIPADSPFRFDPPFAGTVAVRANTVAHLVLNAANIGWSQQPSSAGIVRAVADGTAAAGLVWGPDLALLDSSHSPDFAAPPVLRWNLHAVFRRDNALIEEVNRLIATAEFRANVDKHLVKHRIPVRGPFESVHTPADLLAL